MKKILYSILLFVGSVYLVLGVSSTTASLSQEGDIYVYIPILWTAVLVGLGYAWWVCIRDVWKLTRQDNSKEDKSHE